MIIFVMFLISLTKFFFCFFFQFRFVCEQKPPHLRTPIMVELNSDEDSDVMIVETEIKEESSSTDHGNEPSTSSNARHLFKPSTSKRRRNTDDSSENVNVPAKIVEENANNDVPGATTRRKRRQQTNDENRDDGDGPSRIKMIIRSDPQTPYSSTVTTGALLADCNSPNATMSQARVSFDGSGPSTSASVIRQPHAERMFSSNNKKKSYTIYDASSESSDLDSTDSSSSDSSHEDCKPLKQKRLTKRPSHKTTLNIVKMHNKHKMLAKNLKMKIKMKRMMKRLQEPIDIGDIRGDISTSCSSSSSSSSESSEDDDEDEEKESSSD